MRRTNLLLSRLRANVAVWRALSQLHRPNRAFCSLSRHGDDDGESPLPFNPHPSRPPPPLTRRRLLWTQTSSRSLQRIDSDHHLKVLVEERLQKRDVDGAWEVICQMRQAGVYPNQSLVDRLLSVCAEMKRWDLPIKVIRREGIPLQMSSYHLALEACAAAGRGDQALALLDDMKGSSHDVLPDEQCYLQVLRGCALQGRWEEALRIQHEMKSLGVGGTGGAVMEEVVRALVKGGQVNKALTIIANADQVEVPLLYGAAIKAGCQDGDDVEGSLELLKRTQEEQVAVGGDTIHALLSACRRIGRWQEAISILQGWAHPDTVGYTLAIGACGMGGQWEEAMRLFGVMQSSQPALIPDAVTYLELMDACERSGKWEQVLALLKGPPLPPDDIRLYNAAMRSCMRAKQFETVLQLWHDLSSNPAGPVPTQTTCNYTLRACLNSGRWKDAIKLANGMMANNNNSSPVSSMPSMDIIQEAYFLGLVSTQRSSLWDNFLALIKDMCDRGVPVNDRINRVYNVGLSCCVRERHWASAAALFEAMPKLAVQPDLIACNAAIKAYGELGQHELALRVFDSMLDHGLAPDTITFTTVIQACGRGGRWEQALSLLNAMEASGLLHDSSELAYAVTLDACSRAGEFRGAMDVCEKMAERGLLNKAVSYNAILGMCQKAGDWEKAKAVLTEMRNRGLQPDKVAYTSVIETCGRAGQVDEALRLFQDMRDAGLDIDDITHNTMLDVLARAGRWEESVDLLRSMTETSQLAYNSVIHACSQADKWEQAVELLEEMNTRGLSPDEVTYTTVVNSCSKAGQLDLSIRLLQEMRRDRGLQPNVVAYFSAVKGCHVARDWQRAVALVHDMEASGVPPVAAVYHHAIESCLMSERAEEAFDLLTRMHDRGFSPVAAYYDQTLVGFLNSPAVDWDKVLSLMEKSLTCGVVLPAPTYEKALDLGGRQGKWGMMLAMLDRGAEGPPSVAGVCYPLALYISSKQGDWRRAVMTLREMTARGCRPLNQEDYSLAMDACGLAGRWREAQVLLLEARRLGLKPNMGGFITGCFKAGNMDTVLSVVLDLVNREGLDPTRAGWTAALRAARALGKPKAAVELVHLLGAEANQDDYDMAVEACAASGDWESTLKLLNTMSHQGLKPDVVHLNQVIHAMGRMGQHEVAVELLKRMSKDFGISPDVVTFTSAINACGSSGNWKQAVDLLEEMEKMGLKANVITYTSVIRACGRAGEWKKALGLFQGMEENGLVADLMTYNTVLNACGQAGRVGPALQLLERMGKEGQGIRPDVVSYTAVIKACEKAGQWSTSLEVLQRMGKAGCHPDAMTYNSVLRVLSRAGKWEEVVRLLTDMDHQGVATDIWTERALLGGNSKNSSGGGAAAANARGQALALAQSLRKSTRSTKEGGRRDQGKKRRDHRRL